MRQIANVAALIGTVVFNYLSQSLRLNGNTNDELANRYDILYFPANYAFSIWGLIFVLLGAWAVYQALPSQRDNPHHARIGWLFVLSCLVNVGWLIAFQYEQFILSQIVMVLLLGVLIVIYARLNVGREPVSARDRALIHVPFSVYLGWISAATITNTAYVLYDQGYREQFLGLGAETWAVLLIAASAGLALFTILARRDMVYALVIAWAVSAIGVRYQGVSPIAVSTLIATVVILLAIIFSLFNRQDRTPVSIRPGNYQQQSAR
jgi:tryptophan-rich sensory protein